MKLKATILFTLFLLISVAGYSQHDDYWQQRAEYEMDIDMDTENHQFDGIQKLTYHNNSPDTLRKVYYHLYFNAFQPESMMDVRSRTIDDPDGRVEDRIYHLEDDEIGYHKIDALTQDGNEVDYSIDETIMEVKLAEPILPGESTEFEMEFNSQIPLQVRRSGRDNAEGVDYSMSQWYPKISEYDEEGWHPNPYIGREFYGVFGDFEVNITIDADYVMGGTGSLQNSNEIGHGYETESNFEQPDSDKLTWQWKAEDVHDFMWGADPDFVHTMKEMEDGPTLHFFYQQDTVAEDANENEQDQLTENWEELPEYTAEAFEFMNEHFGEYPYEQFSVVQGGDGGMEYPMATLITGNRSLRSLVGVTVHELIHMWYYGVLANNESQYPWIDEGFTTYASAHTMQQLFNPENEEDPVLNSYDGYFTAHEQGFYEAPITHADHYETNRGYSVGTYTTGAVFLNQLKYIIGNETFQDGMKSFFHEWKYKHPTGEDFLRVMEEESDMVLDWYYEYFIESTKTIDYGINTILDEDGSTFVTLERHDLTPMPIDLMVEYEDGSREVYYIPLRIMRGEKSEKQYPDAEVITEDDWPWVNPTYTVEIPAEASSIERIEIDPSQRMADINRENNVIIMEEYLEEHSN